MSSLTEEQRQRIEANRQRALAIRRTKLAEAAAAATKANSARPQQTAGTAHLHQSTSSTTNTVQMKATTKTLINMGSMQTTNTALNTFQKQSTSSVSKNINLDQVRNTASSAMKPSLALQSTTTPINIKHSINNIRPQQTIHSKLNSIHLTQNIGLQQSNPSKIGANFNIKSNSNVNLVCTSSNSTNPSSNINVSKSSKLDTQTSSTSLKFNNESNTESLANYTFDSNISQQAVKKSIIFGNNSTKQPATITSNYPKTNSMNQGLSTFNKSSGIATLFYGSKQSLKNTTSSASCSTATSDTPASSASSTANSPSRKIFTGKVINGTFSLISRDYFMAEVGYHQGLVSIFKTMPTRRYDADTRRWSFAISDHSDLVTKVKPMRPEVCISPLPDYVIKVLREAECQPPLESVDLSRLDPLLSEALLPFQRDGVRFGVRRGGRVLIADDMGLGKTIQALGIASYYRSDWPMLVVTPSSVRYSWQSALERWLQGCRSDVINTSQDSITDSDVVITSYDLLARRAAEFKEANFGVVIMDESHMMKNFKSARYKAAAPVMKKAKRTILLSGTPALSRPSELYTQITAVDSGLFPSHQNYGIRYCAGKMGNWGWDFNGSSNLKELQIILQSKIMIRRLKSEVLSQLPAKQRQVVILDPASIMNSSSKELKASAKALGSTNLKGTDRHSAMLQFFAHTAHTKLKAVSDYVKELLEAGEKFLVFAHHRVMLDNLCKTCERQKTLYIRIDGGTPGDTRQALVDEFQQREDVRVAVLSILAASTGITLTAASLVLFAELYWNPGILVQAEDRVHRLGQEDSVSIHYLVAKGTADDHIWPMVQQKLNILGKAGLSKDDFSESDATYQKSDESSGIMQYLVNLNPEEMQEMEQEYSFDSTEAADESSSASKQSRDADALDCLTPSKKQKLN